MLLSKCCLASCCEQLTNYKILKVYSSSEAVNICLELNTKSSAERCGRGLIPCGVPHGGILSGLGRFRSSMDRMGQIPEANNLEANAWFFFRSYNLTYKGINLGGWNTKILEAASFLVRIDILIQCLYI